MGDPGLSAPAHGPWFPCWGGAHLALLAARGPRCSGATFLSSPSSELRGLSACGCITPVDSRPSCGLYALEQNCLPYFCTERAGNELQEPGNGLGRATLLKGDEGDPGNSTAVDNSLALEWSYGCVRLPLERLKD